MDAEAESKKGGEAFKREAYEDALAHYSKAIKLSPSTGKYYSNRAMTYYKLGKYVQAVDDADRCATRDPTNTKCYNTKGASLEKLSRPAEALEAYRQSLKRNPSDARARMNLALLQHKQASGGGGGGGGAGAGMGAAPPTSTGTDATSAHGGPVAGSGFMPFVNSNRKLAALALVRTFILANAVMYLLPISGSYSAYGRVMLTTVALQAANLYLAHGRPKFNIEYASKIIQDQSVNSMFLALLFWTGRPIVAALFPVVSIEAAHAFDYWYKLSIAAGAKGVQAALEKGANMVGPRLTSDPQFTSLSTYAKWNKSNLALLQLNSWVEVGIGFLLILEAFTPLRNLLFLMIYWQMLRVHYMLSAQIQATFSTLHLRILGLTQSSMCPSIVSALYVKLSGVLAGMVAMPKPGAQPQGGLMSKCSIM